ncbi:MAG: DNA-binding response regulator [Verrucomicrobia bacterium]|nr:DNA-binding response regulator [Verrucomicrobiota bacterium]
MSALNKTRIRLVLVDDSEVVRTGLRTLLGSENSLELVGEAGSVAAAVTACARLKPDVVVLDIRLPDGTGFEACRQILRLLPDTRVLVLTSVVDETLVDEAIRAGAHGYLLKEIDRRGLLQAILDVAAGKSILDPAVTSRVIQLVRDGSGATRSALAILSAQERKVLALISEGRTNKEVGVALGLAEKTVKNYLSNVFEKLHVSRRSQAAVMFARESRGSSQPPRPPETP